MGPADTTRYGRQIRLAEIGEAGQVRLLAAAPTLGARGFAREVERAYLALAGASPVDSGAAAPAEVDVAALGLRHDAAREVGEGALRALAALRAIVDGGG